jgi:uncharacterized protein YggT (Ycf19 family)
MRPQIKTDNAGMDLNFSAFWLICFVGGSLLMGVAALSCAFQHGLPLWGVGVFLLWLVIFAFLVIFSQALTRPVHWR